MFIGSVANGLNSPGAFCGIAYRRGLPSHQRHLLRFLRRSPGAPRTLASEGINILQNTLSVLNALQENMRAIRAVLDRVEAITIPAYVASPIIHIHLRSAMLSASVSAKCTEPCDACAARGTVVQHCG